LFVLRRRRWRIGLGLLLGALLYTHAWAAFFAATAGVGGLALVVAAAADDRRAIAIDLVVAFGAAALVFAPWVPTALDQAQHTGAPWSHPPAPHSVPRALTRVLGGVWPEWLLLAGCAAGVAVVLIRGGAAQRRAIGALIAIAAGTLMLAYLVSRHVTPAWALRYQVIVLAPLLLAVAAALARCTIAGLAVLAIVAVMWSDKPTIHQLASKSNVAMVATRLGPQLHAGAVVFSLQPEQVAALQYYLPPGLRYATPLGPSADPRVMNWREALARLRAARYGHTLGRLVSRLHGGQRLLLVAPRFGHPSASWTRTIRALARSWTPLVLRDRRLRVLAHLEPLRYGNRSTVAAILLERRAARLRAATPASHAGVGHPR
jgi:hypothetical protein